MSEGAGLVDGLKARLAREGSKVIEDKADGWLERLIASGQDDLNDAVTANPAAPTILGLTLTPKDAAEAGEALALLQSNRAPFLRLGNVGFAFLVGHWKDAKKAEARRRYLETAATYDERRAAMHAGTDAVAAERAERDAAWAKVEEILLKIGVIGLKLLVRIAARSVGVPLPV